MKTHHYSQGVGPLFDSVKPNFSKSEFDGVTYEPKFDATRLRGEMEQVYDLMLDGRWRTLRQISLTLIRPEASISARLRDFRKKPMYLTVERRRRGDPKRGIFEYRVIL